MMSVHSQNSKCEGSRISVARLHRRVALQRKHVQLKSGADTGKLDWGG